jgi:hypothetical protein
MIKYLKEEVVLEQKMKHNKLNINIQIFKIKNNMINIIKINLKLVFLIFLFHQVIKHQVKSHPIKS